MDKQTDAWPDKARYLEEEKAYLKAWIARAQRKINEHQKRLEDINLEIKIENSQNHNI